MVRLCLVWFGDKGLLRGRGEFIIGIIRGRKMRVEMIVVCMCLLEGNFICFIWRWECRGLRFGEG